jgi:hypothetical protein
MENKQLQSNQQKSKVMSLPRPLIHQQIQLNFN